MIVAITSTVLFSVPDEVEAIADVADRFRRANEVAIGIPMQTLTGQPYVMIVIERFRVEVRRDGGEAQ